jgi:hypothetical protein
MHKVSEREAKGRKRIVWLEVRCVLRDKGENEESDTDMARIE